MKIVITTEVWKTRKGRVVKAVARDKAGHFLGATNQTRGVELVGKK